MVFFICLLPVLKTNQPKTQVFTVFWQDNMQKKEKQTTLSSSFPQIFSSCASIQKTLIFYSIFANAHPDSRRC